MNTWVLNFANSIVGVGVLAIPFCFHVCGIGIASLMVVITNLLTRKTCEYLLTSGQMTRKSGYESLAGHLLGPFGKLVTELGIIGLMLGTLVSFQVVIGDLAPALVSSFFNFEETWSLRTTLMVFSSIGVIPLGLMRNISSLANLNALSMGFYCIFIIVVVLTSLKNLFSGLWIAHLNFWRPEGIFHCLPIISLAFSCQTQVFVMYEAIPEPSIKSMMNIIDRAINLVTVMYLSVGTFGYIAFYETGIRGDILANFPGGMLSDIIKTGFWISIIISFPLIIFPLRMALHSLLFSREKKAHEVISSAADYIPQHRFTAISLGLIGITLTIGILIPHIETVLSITGALIGSFLCFVFPAGLYIMSTARAGATNSGAKVIFAIGVVCMVASTWAVLSGGQTSDQSEHKAHPGHDAKSAVDSIPVSIPDSKDMRNIKIGKPFQLPGSLQDEMQKKVESDSNDKESQKAKESIGDQRNEQKLMENNDGKSANNEEEPKQELPKNSDDSVSKQEVIHESMKNDGIGGNDKAAMALKKDDMLAAKQIDSTEAMPITNAVKGDVRKLQQVSNESENQGIKAKKEGIQANNRSHINAISKLEIGQGIVQAQIINPKTNNDENQKRDAINDSTKNSIKNKITDKVTELKTEKIDVKHVREMRSIDVVDNKQANNEMDNAILRRPK